jgi:molybdenum cofactor synthesis domain-containing protein
VENHGLRGDAHAGAGGIFARRQVSILSAVEIRAFRERAVRCGAARDADEAERVVPFGAFGENLVVDCPLSALEAGALLQAGEATLRVSQKGKECGAAQGAHRCAIYEKMGDCIMPREGIFAVVEKSGAVKTGDQFSASDAIPALPYSCAVLTVSDKGAVGARIDTSGPAVAEMLKKAGYTVAETLIVPDERAEIEKTLARLADSGYALVLTSGGTGFAPRDVTPEATTAVCERMAPGLAEAMRAGSMAITKRAMLGRAVAGIRGSTLIVNLPGSPKGATESLSFIIDELKHGLDILTGHNAEHS